MRESSFHNDKGSLSNVVMTMGKSERMKSPRSYPVHVQFRPVEDPAHCLVLLWPCSIDLFHRTPSSGHLRVIWD